MLAEVEYLQVAFSSVRRDIVVWVVPAGNVPPGAPPERMGGVVSEVVAGGAAIAATSEAVRARLYTRTSSMRHGHRSSPGPAVPIYSGPVVVIGVSDVDKLPTGDPSI